MKIDLNELEALARAATPGPWEATRQTDDECSFMGYFIEAGDKTISDDGTAPGHADALFIAAANPAAVLDLIALARQADGAETVAIPLVSGEELLARTQPLPKWIDDMKGSGPTTDSLIEYIEQLHGDLQVQQPAPPVQRWQDRYNHGVGSPAKIECMRLEIEEWRALFATLGPAASVQPDASLVKRLTHERDALGQAIVDAALKAGMFTGEVPLTGPHLIMFAQHLGEATTVQPDHGLHAALLEQAAQACDRQADGTNGPYRSACLQCANAVRALRDDAVNAEAATPTSQETPS